MPLRVTIWHEFRHEKRNPAVGKVYPDGLHVALKQGLEKYLGTDAEIRLATLDDPHQGLPDDVLDSTDVMLWWGHGYHPEVQDHLAARVASRVRCGMGLIVLHSGHYAKVFQLLMGTRCHLKWRDAGEKERLWVVSPGHPITAGLTSDCLVLDKEEMYGEHFDIPEPEELVFISWFEGGEVFRSGCVWKRGAGKIFYFRPGHELFPTYYNEEIRRVISNAVKYVAPSPDTVPYRDHTPHIAIPLEPVKGQSQSDPSLHHNQPT